MRYINKKGIAVAILIAGVALGSLAFKAVDFRTSKSLDIFFSFFRELSIFYVDPINPEALIKTGIDAMLESLDPYNELVTEENLDQLEFQTTGEYGGMGALIRRAGNDTKIAEVYEGAPAHEAGLMAGDIILSINGVTTRGMNVESVSRMLKGTPNTDLRLRIERTGTPDTLLFEFKRRRIHISSVTYHGMVSPDIGYIKLINFTSNSSREVESALRDLTDKQGAKSLILDLRGNPGGLLNEAVRVVNLFVGKNELIVYTRGQIKQFDTEYRTSSEPVNTSIPIVVMVDRASASAAEIVAGALQDLDRAVIVGERTFGKGLVQVTRALPYNTHLKLTTAKYYIPSGRCIQALDFSNMNEDGSVGTIPDSLITAFTTRNGRTVYNGGGVLPDLLHAPPSYNRITTMLFAQNLIFNFATKYRSINASIESPKSFRLTTDEYNNFKQFILDNNFEFQSSTEYHLNEMISSSKEENYYSIAGGLIDSLQSVIVANRMKDLDFSEPQIRRLLEEEIVSRYYFQRGRTEFQTVKDSGISFGIQTLQDVNRFTSILARPADRGNI